jgi:Grap2 and cyclin-D-interacting
MDSTLEGLRRLSETLAALSPASRSDVLARCRSGSDPHSDDNEDKALHCWTHYRVLPPEVRQSYEMLEQGAQLVHATSTKFALMAKIDGGKSHEMAHDLLRGCSWVGTACLVLDPRLGGAARRHALNAGRSVVRSVLHLLLEEQPEHQGDDAQHNHQQPAPPSSSALAQRTGVVWESCDVILNRQLPLGNRTAMRRELLGYMKECQETVIEFQAMIDAGPLLLEDAEGKTNPPSSKDDDVDRDDDDDEDEWDAFLDGETDRYRPEELAAVVPCVAMVKCSRGTLNLVLQALDVMGARLEEAKASAAAMAPSSSASLEDSTASSPQELSSEDKDRLQRMERLYELACLVGIGMTDLGAALYPPLDCDAVGVQVLRQSGAIESVLRAVISISGEDEQEAVATVQANAEIDEEEWPPAVRELHAKLAAAVSARRAEALEALAEADAGAADETE